MDFSARTGGHHDCSCGGEYSTLRGDGLLDGQSCRRGTDRYQLREYKFPSVAYFPVESPVTLRHPAQHQPHIDRTLWGEIAERARCESLRALAAEYGVSHETIRTILQREASKRVAEVARTRLIPSAACRPRIVDWSR